MFARRRTIAQDIHDSLSPAAHPHLVYLHSRNNNQLTTLLQPYAIPQTTDPRRTNGRSLPLPRILQRQWNTQTNEMQAQHICSSKHVTCIQFRCCTRLCKTGGYDVAERSNLCIMQSALINCHKLATRRDRRTVSLTNASTTATFNAPALIRKRWEGAHGHRT